MPQQLLQINTTYGKIRIDSSNGEFFRIRPPGSSQPEMTMRTQRGGGMKMQKKPGKLELNMMEVLNSVGNITIQRSIDNYAQEGKEAAMEATAKFARQGNMYMDPNVNGVLQSASQIVLEDANQTYGTAWIPTVPLHIEFTPEELEFNYIRDRISLDVKLGESEFDYRAGDVNTSVAQNGDVSITYVGGPNYFPTAFQRFNKLV